MHPILQAQCTETAEDFAAVASNLLPDYGPETVSAMLRVQWPRFTGRKVIGRLIKATIRATARSHKIDTTGAAQMVGEWLMTETEREAFSDCVVRSKVTVASVTNLTISTGWFRSVAEANPQWPRRGAPFAKRVAEIRPERDLLAIKFFGEVPEFVLVPERSLQLGLSPWEPI